MHTTLCLEFRLCRSVVKLTGCLPSRLAERFGKICVKSALAYDDPVLGMSFTRIAVGFANCTLRPKFVTADGRGEYSAAAKLELVHPSHDAIIIDSRRATTMRNGNRGGAAMATACAWGAGAGELCVGVLVKPWEHCSSGKRKQTSGQM